MLVNQNKYFVSIQKINVSVIQKINSFVIQNISSLVIKKNSLVTQKIKSLVIKKKFFINYSKEYRSEIIFLNTFSMHYIKLKTCT